MYGHVGLGTLFRDKGNSRALLRMRSFTDRQLRSRSFVTTVLILAPAGSVMALEGVKWPEFV